MTNPPVDLVQTQLPYLLHAVAAAYAFGVVAVWVQLLPRLLGMLS
jgi:hypothetical protein